MLRASFFGPANLMTMLRLPLAAWIWKKPGDRRFVLGVLAAAGATDLLDGQLARRFPGTADPSGAWLDPLCDKIFVLSALGAVTTARKPEPLVPWLIAAREIVQGPLVLLYLTRVGGAMPTRPKINWRAAHVGKVATVIQFSAIGALLLRHRWTKRLSVAAGIAGPVAAAYYFRRALEDSRQAVWHETEDRSLRAA